MGYDQHRQSGSWGILSCIGAVAVLLVVGLGIIALIGVGVAIWQDFGGVPQVAVVEQQAAVELHDLEDIELDRMVPLQRQDASFADSSDPRLNFVLELDREGNTSVDGEKIDLDEVRAKLVKLKDETSNAFSVRINADPECPAKHVVSVLDVCEEVGDIDYRIKSFEGPAVQVTATVASYEPAAEWDHFDDGTFAAYDRITLQVVSPERHAGTTLSITVPPTALPDDSAFRAAGTRLTFTMQASDIAATGLSWGAIDDPTIVQLPVIPP